MNNKNSEYQFSPSITLDQELVLQSGVSLKNVKLAYQTYGKLNSEKSNTILICHALTGDQFVSGKHPITGKNGWWNELVGPGKVIDTNIYCVICTNIPF